MKHDQLTRDGTFDIVDLAAIWPRPDGSMQFPVGPLEAAVDSRSTPAAPDVPAALGAMIVGVYVAIMAVFFLTMATGAYATFMISIGVLYVIAFFAVPRIFLAVEDDRSTRPTLREFDKLGLDTLTGHLSGRAALVQILVVPIMLSIPVLVMGVTALLVLP